MKKKIAFLLAVLLTLCLSTVAFANAAEVSKEDQMAVMVKNFLDKNEYPYEYDDYMRARPNGKLKTMHRRNDEGGNILWA